MDEDLPGYAWDLLPYREKPLDPYRAHFWHTQFDHAIRIPFVAIYTSLGCNFGCDFCMINIVNRGDNRVKAWTPRTHEGCVSGARNGSAAR